VGDATFTFLRFETDTSGDHGAGMRVNAIVRIENAGLPPEEVTLPFVADDRGYRGEAVRPASLGGSGLVLERMAVDQRRVIVKWTTGEGAGEILVVNASVKPLMNLLWAGTILMPLGCGIAVTRRWIDRRALLAAESAADEKLRVAPSRPDRTEAARSTVRAKSRKGKPAPA
jgi:hypothetical protein